MFKTLIRRYHELMKCVAQRPDHQDRESARALLQALEQLAVEAERLEAQLRILGEKREAAGQDRPQVSKPRLVWPPKDPENKRQV